jgi:phosphate transport system protein
MVLAQGEHTLRGFDEELAAVRRLVSEMGGVVEVQIGDAIEALEDGDVDGARQVIERDYVVNRYDVEANDEMASIIARRQPAGSDLRLLLSLGKTVTDLERIGDEAEKIGRMTLLLNEHGRLGVNSSLLRDVGSMGRLARQMVHEVLDALARMDVQAAIQVAQGDRNLDEEFRAALRRLVTYMMEDPRVIGQAIDVLFVIKALERIGDHAKNIAEYVVYLVKGQDVRHVSKDQLPILV